MYSQIKTFFNKPWKIAAGLICLAVIFRMALLSTAYYGMSGELYRDLIVVWKMFNQNQLPLLGPSSMFGGFYFGAIYYYIFGVLAWLTGFSAYSGSLTSTIFSIGSIVFLYALLRRLFNDPKVALIAVALQTICLFDIQNTYYISNPNLLPFFVLGFFYFLTNIISNHKLLSNYLLAGLFFGIAIQLHATALVILPFVLIWIGVKEKIKPSFGQSLLFIAAMLIPNTPYLIYIYQNGFGIFGSLLEIAGSQGGMVNRLNMLSAIGNFIFSFFVFKDGAFNFYPGHANLYFTALGISIVLIAIVLWQLKKKVFDFNISTTAKTFLTAWPAVGLLVYLIFAPQPAYYYFIVMWPFPVIIAAIFLNQVWGYSKKTFTIVVALYIVLQFMCVGVFYKEINKPALSHNAVAETFSTIKSLTQNQSYSIINDALDINQFNYYLLYSNLKIRNIESPEYKAYYISKCGGEVIGKLIKNTQGLCLSVEVRTR